MVPCSGLHPLSAGLAGDRSPTLRLTCERLSAFSACFTEEDKTCDVTASTPSLNLEPRLAVQGLMQYPVQDGIQYPVQGVLAATQRGLACYSPLARCIQWRVSSSTRHPVQDLIQYPAQGSMQYPVQNSIQYPSLEAAGRLRASVYCVLCCSNRGSDTAEGVHCAHLADKINYSRIVKEIGQRTIFIFY